MPTAQDVQDYIKTYTGVDATQKQMDFYVVRPWTELATNVCDYLLKTVHDTQTPNSPTVLAPGTYTVR